MGGGEQEVLLGRGQRGEARLVEVAVEAIVDIRAGHLEQLYAFYGERMGVRIARKHLGWYAKDRPENTAFRHVVNQAEDAATQLRLTREYFDALDAGVPAAA